MPRLTIFALRGLGLRCAVAAFAACAGPSAALAQAPTPAPKIDACNEARRAAASRNLARIATYYELNLALIDGKVYQWKGSEEPRRALDNAVHVTVSLDLAYAIDKEGKLIRWRADQVQPEAILDSTVFAAAGRTGVLAIRCDGTLWRLATGSAAWELMADNVVHAWVGDGADYYIDNRGRLHATGLADRGQYGDGQLVRANGWRRVADRAARVVAHMGHALYLNLDGMVLGAGSNLHGPLGELSYGDQANKWGKVFEKATDMTTGIRHSAALRADGSLWIWGGDVGVGPRRMMAGVVEAAAGEDHTLALKSDWTLWILRGREAPKQVKLPD